MTTPPPFQISITAGAARHGFSVKKLVIEDLGRGWYSVHFTVKPRDAE